MIILGDRKAQYVRRLSRWGIKKNTNSDTWRHVANMIQNRSGAGKDTAIEIDGKTISRKRLMKEMGRASIKKRRTGVHCSSILILSFGYRVITNTTMTGKPTGIVRAITPPGQVTTTMAQALVTPPGFFTAPVTQYTCLLFEQLPISQLHISINSSCEPPTPSLPIRS